MKLYTISNVELSIISSSTSNLINALDAVDSGKNVTYGAFVSVPSFLSILDSSLPFANVIVALPYFFF